MARRLPQGDYPSANPLRTFAAGCLPPRRNHGAGVRRRQWSPAGVRLALIVWPQVRSVRATASRTKGHSCGRAKTAGDSPSFVRRRRHPLPRPMTKIEDPVKVRIFRNIPSALSCTVVQMGNGFSAQAAAGSMAARSLPLQHSLAQFRSRQSGAAEVSPNRASHDMPPLSSSANKNDHVSLTAC